MLPQETHREIKLVKNQKRLCISICKGVNHKSWYTYHEI